MLRLGGSVSQTGSSSSSYLQLLRTIEVMKNYQQDLEAKLASRGEELPTKPAVALQEFPGVEASLLEEAKAKVVAEAQDESFEDECEPGTMETDGDGSEESECEDTPVGRPVATPARDGTMKLALDPAKLGKIIAERAAEVATADPAPVRAMPVANARPDVLDVPPEPCAPAEVINSRTHKKEYMVLDSWFIFIA